MDEIKDDVSKMNEPDSTQIQNDKVEFNSEAVEGLNPVILTKDETPKAPLNVKAADVVLGFICLALAFFFVHNTFFMVKYDKYYGEEAYIDHMRFSSGLGMFLFTVAFVCVVNLYAVKKQKKATKESFFWMILLLLQGLGFLLFARPSMGVIPMLALFVTAVYWVVCRFSMLTVAKTSDYVITDVLRGIFGYPFQYFFHLGRVFTSSLKQKKLGKTVTQVIVGVLVGIPIIIIFYDLLCQVDEGFANVISVTHWFDFILDRQALTIAKMILAIPVSCYMFGLIYGLSEQTWEDTGKDPVIEITGKCGFVSMPTVTTILTMVVVLYTMFFAVQASYLFSAFGNQLPVNYTYAEYARRGFFELCAICVLNLMLLFFAHLICKGANPKVLKVFTLIMYGFTALFLVIAFRKMLLYITTYGLTQRRMLTCWFMVAIAVVIIIGILREFRRFPMLRFASFAVIILFTICSLSNMDGMIAANNGWLYENGKMETPDYVTLADCGIAGLPTVDRLIENETDPDVLKELKSVRRIIEKNYHEDRSFFEIVLQDVVNQ